MFKALIDLLGPWNWMVLGLLLLVAELFVPGVFLVWLGIAAVIVGALSLMFWSLAFWVWWLQVLVFLFLALVSVYLGNKFWGGSNMPSEEPLLNRRAEQLIGSTATLSEPILEGHGRIRLGDTLWRVSGPDLPIGARVKVVSVKDMELVVEKI